MKYPENVHRVFELAKNLIKQLQLQIAFVGVQFYINLFHTNEALETKQTETSKFHNIPNHIGKYIFCWEIEEKSR